MNTWNNLRFDFDDYGKADYIYRLVLSIAKIPPIRFNPEWDVRIIPPFGGALMRFTVDYNGKHISVYCDFFEILGSFGGEPYWEMYPRTYKDFSDTMRFPLNDTESLVANIDAELRGKIAE